jgi:hypothetical protein
MILLCAPLFIEAQRKSSLAARIEQAIKKHEIGWRRGNASAILIFPEHTKVLVDSGWYRVTKSGNWETVNLSVYEMESWSIASGWLGWVKERKISPTWKVESFGSGDEAYLNKSPDNSAFFLIIRKNNVVIEVAGDSMENVIRFAQYVLPLVDAV